MVQNSRTTITIWASFLRIILFIAVIAVGFFPPLQLYTFINQDLGYVSSGGFFGFDFSNWEVTWVMYWTLLSGIVFGTLGKKIDYFIILFFIFFAIYDYSTPIPVNQNLYLALTITIVVSNAIGFGFKLLRQKFLPKLKV